MKKLYTSIGRFCRRGHGNMTYPYVMVSGRECVLDTQEMLIWALLNWRIVEADQVEWLYQASAEETGVGILHHRTAEDCLTRLVQRGLVMEGCGDTGADALYSLLSELYIIPISESLFLRVASFIRLTIFGGVPYTITRDLFRRDRRSEPEQQVVRLSNQTMLSTAELIKCAELHITELPTEETLLEALYGDEFTTSDNLVESVRFSDCRNTVLTAIANLYLRKQVILERI